MRIAARCNFTVGLAAVVCSTSILQHLYIGGDVNRLDVGQPADLVPLDPAEEVARGLVIGHARVLVADRRREKFEKPLRGMIAGVGDHSRYDDLVGDRSDGPCGGFWDERVHGR
jgi:hypothetical protein